MMDPLLAAATAELSHEQLPGLRRRYQADQIFQRTNDEDGEDGEGTSPHTGETADSDNTGNWHGNIPMNNRIYLSPQHASTIPTNDTRNDGGDDGVTNLNITSVGQPSLTTNAHSPLSGSIGIGVFNISRMYCFLSIISTLIAIVLAPIPTHQMEFHDLATIIYEVSEGNGVILKNSQMIESEKYNRTSGGNASLNIVDNMNSIVADFKSYSVEEFINLATFTGFVTSGKQRVESSEVSVGSNNMIGNKKDAGNEQRKRRRRPAVSIEKHDDDSNENLRSLVNEVQISLSTSTPSKTRTSLGNESRNISIGNTTTRIPASRMRNFLKRINILIEETFSEAVQGSKKKLKMVIDRKQKQISSMKNYEEIGDETKGHEGNYGYSSGSREGNAEINNMEHTRKLLDEWQWIDPIIFDSDSFQYIVSNITDKMLKSTIRLCVVANLILAMTCLLHSAVADLFLSRSRSSEGSNSVNSMHRQHGTSLREDSATIVSASSFASSSEATGARERIGGFLIFKLLLISAVLAPDTLYLIILVTWFTLLGCLRSLDQLAHSSNINLVAIGQPPKKGIVQLLVWVLACDIVAAGSCLALFHTEGYGIVLLLVCDCALLGTDVMSHILKYYQSVLENSHDNDIRDLEERQLNLHRLSEDGNVDGNVQDEEEREEAYTSGHQERTVLSTAILTPNEIRQESGRLDHQMEGLQLVHERQLSILDTATFCLDIACHILTVAHFCHIWAMHGVQFTLIDGVLALHLHSAISTACAKLARRRNVHNLDRDLEGRFTNATDEELKQVSTDGDVCCICLGSMSIGGKVKKLHCGHIFHTHCLREVIKRAQNLQSAKCPLCRAPLVNDCNSVTHPLRRNDNLSNINFARQDNIPVNAQMQAARAINHTIDSDVGDDNIDAVHVHQAEDERAIIQFSTEGILPAWLPVPAFSFEVVRQPPLGPGTMAQSQNQQILTTTHVSTQRTDQGAITSLNQEETSPELQTEYETEASQSEDENGHTRVNFFQRVMLFMGYIPMSPEAEARALTQLVDVFPQYDRGDLSRELRNRGSLEAVTEAILIGAVPLIPSGE